MSATDSRPSSSLLVGRDLPRYLVLLLQLGALLVVFRLFDLESPRFHWLAALVFLGAAVQYWLPLPLKRPFIAILSLGGAFLLLAPVTALLLISVSIGMFLLLSRPLPYWWRVLGVIGFGVAILSSRFGVPGRVLPVDFVPVFGAIFMFRMIIYLYDLKHSSEAPSFLDYLNYFLMLPNYYFLLFPVVDFETLKRGYLNTDYHEIAQTGVRWIVRGTLHLLLYRIVFSIRPAPDPVEINSLSRLLFYMFCTYLLYLRVSGQFHIVTGMLHLFGFNLPRTNRNYLLASNLADFWRRINIYWKDFMLKIIYMPMFFKLRKRGEVLAITVSTLAVFLATWALHSYQWYWLKGEWLLSQTDVLFWAILGLLFLMTMLYQNRAPAKPVHPRSGLRAALSRTFSTLVTLLTIMTLWSLWNAPTVEAWIDLLHYW